MPYRAKGHTVLVEKNGEWVVYKRLPTAERARKMAAALNIHVHHKGQAKKSK